MKQNNTNRSIRDLMREIVKDPNAEIYSVVGEIIEIDETARTCDVKPLNGDAEIFGVRLQSESNSTDGFVIIPTKNSVGIVTFINRTTGILSVCNKIDKVILKSEIEINIDCEKITFNGGSNDGLIKINDLITKLNAVENDLNDLKTIFSATWVPVPQDGGASLKTASASWAGATITPTQKSDIENDKIKH
jgi:hypothetical protein